MFPKEGGSNCLNPVGAAVVAPHNAESLDIPDEHVDWQRVHSPHSMFSANWGAMTML